jgi:hypothetical protein
MIPQPIATSSQITSQVHDLAGGSCGWNVATISPFTIIPATDESLIIKVTGTVNTSNGFDDPLVGMRIQPTSISSNTSQMALMQSRGTYGQYSTTLFYHIPANTEVKLELFNEGNIVSTIDKGACVIEFFVI